VLIDLFVGRRRCVVLCDVFGDIIHPPYCLQKRTMHVDLQTRLRQASSW